MDVPMDKMPMDADPFGGGAKKPDDDPFGGPKSPKKRPRQSLRRSSQEGAHAEKAGGRSVRVIDRLN